MNATKMTFVAMFMTILFLMGCQPAVDPLPEPVKMYLTGSATFTRVDAAGTLAYADIYQYDGVGTMYTGSDVKVTFDATFGTEWTIRVGGNTYLNDNMMNVPFTNDGDTITLVASGDRVQIEYSIGPTMFDMFASVIFIDVNSIKWGTGVVFTWTR